MAAHQHLTVVVSGVLDFTGGFFGDVPRDIPALKQNENNKSGHLQNLQNPPSEVLKVLRACVFVILRVFRYQGYRLAWRFEDAGFVGMQKFFPGPGRPA